MNDVSSLFLLEFVMLVYVALPLFVGSIDHLSTQLIDFCNCIDNVIVAESLLKWTVV